jgi:hypothetical protein
MPSVFSLAGSRAARRRLLLQACAAAVALGGVSRPALADAVTVRAEAAAASARIRFLGAAAPSCKPEVSGRELLLRCERPVELGGADEALRSLQGWIESITTGFDTLLVRAARGVAFAVRLAEGELVVDVTPIRDEGSPADQAEADLRIELLRAELLAARGRREEAFRALADLLQKHPSSAPVLARMAELHAEEGRWRRAETLYGRAIALEPRNEEFAEGRARVLRDQTPRVRFDADRKSVSGGWTETVVRASGYFSPIPYFRVGAAIENDDAEIDAVRYPDGTIGPLHGARQRAEIYLQHDTESGLGVRGSLLAGRSGAGLGLFAFWPERRGRTELQIDFRRPYWEFIEGIAGSGVRDRIQIRRELGMGRLGARLAGSYSRYGLARFRDAARTAGFEAGATWVLVRSRTNVALEYGFDGEYRRSFHQGLSSDGLRFDPLPLVSREVHAPGVSARRKVTRDLEAEGSVGFSWDRFGGSGPFTTARLTWDGRGRVAAQLWFDRRLNSVATGQVVTRAGAYVMWRFD